MSANKEETNGLINSFEETKELTSEEKLEALVTFDKNGSPDQMTEEQKLEMMKRQWELFEQHWKQLGRRQKRKLIKQDSRYSSKLKQRLKNT